MYRVDPNDALQTKASCFPIRERKGTSKFRAICRQWTGPRVGARELAASPGPRGAGKAAGFQPVPDKTVMTRFSPASTSKFSR